MSKDLITVKQLPVIEDQLRQVKKRIEERVATALTLVVNENTYKEVKRVRAALSKEYRALEDRRKEVKKAILAPYVKFEELYKTCAGDIYAEADAKLKKKIDEVEDGIKSEKADEIRAYFSEYCKSKNIDFIKFEDAGINVTMSASKKSLKERSAAFIDKVSEDLELIETQEHKEEILVEYKKSLNVAQAITTVTSRKEAIERERKRCEELEAQREKAAKAQKKVEAAVENNNSENEISEPANAPVSAPVSAPTETIITPTTDEPVYSTSFRVLGTIEQLKALKQFLEEGGYNYEQL